MTPEGTLNFDGHVPSCCLKALCWRAYREVSLGYYFYCPKCGQRYELSKSEDPEFPNFKLVEHMTKL
jgi:hypothetical protein